VNRGYVKLWRKSIDGGWLSNHKLWVFWCWCLMKASHKEYDLVVGYTQVHLMPGEFVFGLRKASKELKISIQSIRTILEFLKTSQNLTHRSTHLFSIISIVNWDTYQSQENEINTPINKQVTHGQHTGNNKQEHKNIKNVKKDIIKKDLFLDCVKLSDEEVVKLREKFNGQFDAAIAELNNYKMSSGKKYNSDYHALIGWVAKKFFDDNHKKEAYEV